MTNFFQKHKLLLILILLVTALGIATYFLVNSFREKGVFEKVSRGNIIEAIYGIGTVQSNRTHTMKVGVPSVVQKVFVKEGQSVKRGDPLFDLDLPKRFFAPFSGVISALFVKEGETLFPQTPALTIADFSDRFVLVSVEQQGLLKAQVGQLATISFESMRSQKFEGRVSSIYSNPTGFYLRIDAPKLPDVILPEMSADVAIIVNTHENVLLVPASAVDLGNVYIKKNDISPLIQTPVKIGLLDGSMAQIIAGEVHEGDLVRIKKGK